MSTLYGYWTQCSKDHYFKILFVKSRFVSFPKRSVWVINTIQIILMLIKTNQNITIKPRQGGMKLIKRFSCVYNTCQKNF